MIYIFMFISLTIGIFIGATAMYYRARHLLHNQKNLHHELQNSKVRLNEYQKELSNHFNYTIELLSKMAEDYRNLYHNTKKSANFFLPNTHIQDNIGTFNIKKTKISNEQLPIKAPLDYSDTMEKTLKHHDNK